VIEKQKGPNLFRGMGGAQSKIWKDHRNQTGDQLGLKQKKYSEPEDHDSHRQKKTDRCSRTLTGKQRRLCHPHGQMTEHQ